MTNFAELASTALILERQRDAAIAVGAQYRQERDSLRTSLQAAITSLREAQDKFWVFHCNAYVPINDTLGHRGQDKEMMATKSKEMGEAAARIEGILSIIAK